MSLKKDSDEDILLLKNIKKKILYILLKRVMLKKINAFTANVKDYLVDHPQTRKWSRWVLIFFVEIISAFAFAYGFRAFTAPDTTCVTYWQKTDNTITDADVSSPTRLISGGASGVSQTIVRIISIFVNISKFENIIVSICYFLLNVPIFILAFKKISKQFTIFTFINVLFTSLFNTFIPSSWVYNVINIYKDVLARAIFAGICTGISSGLAMLVGTSTGGYDCITVYISEKKSTSVGKYSLLLNSLTVCCFVIFSVIGINVNPSWNTQNTNVVVTFALYTIVYFFISSHVTDFLNQKNKKQELQIFTSNPDIPTILIHTFPHSATVIDSHGAFSGKKNYVVYMVISKNEAKKALAMVANADSKAFVTVIDINQVFGRFYIKPFD